MNMYRVIKSGLSLWTVGFHHPITKEWAAESDHSTREMAGERRNWLNGTLRRGLVYRRTEEFLWTVGHFNERGEWCPDEDHGNRQAAARSVAQGNGTNLWEHPQWQGDVARIAEEG